VPVFLIGALFKLRHDIVFLGIRDDIRFDFCARHIYNVAMSLYSENLVTLSLTFKASFCNQWPELKIVSNNRPVWQGHIEGQNKITVQFERLPENHVSIFYINKRNGPEVWDTKIDLDGNILEDQNCVLEQILIDHASCDWLITKTPYHYNEGLSKMNFGFMDLQGHMDLTFPGDVYQWIIDYRQSIKPVNTKNSSLDYKNVYIPQNESTETKKIITNIKQLLQSFND